jgi:hypothetical protein
VQNSGIQEGISDIMELVKTQYVAQVQHACNKLQSAVSLSENPDSIGACITGDMFSSLYSAYKRNKFYEVNFGVTVPVAVRMIEKFIAKKVRGMQKFSKFNGYYVPFIKQLESLLS